MDRPRLGNLWKCRIDRWLPWLLPLLIFLLTAAVGGIFYETNDDLVLADIVSGAYGGADCVHLIFINIAFGCLLRPFYWLAGGLNWYVIVCLALIYLSMVLLCHAAVHVAGSAGYIFFTVGALIFTPYLVCQFEFTKNAGIYAIAGLAWVAVFLGDGLKKTWPGIVLALLGSLIRWQMFMAVGGLSAFMLLGRFFAMDKDGKRRAIANVGLLLVAAFAFHGADTLLYQLDEGWQEYFSLAAPRGQIMDYKPLRTAIVPEGSGMSQTEYDTILRWDFYDEDAFSAEALWELADAIPNVSFRSTFYGMRNRLLYLFYGENYHLLLVFSIILCLLLFCWDPRTLLLQCGTVLMLWLETFYLLWKMKLPARVEIPLLLAAEVFLLLCPAYWGYRRFPNWLKEGGLAFFVAAGVLLSIPPIQEMHINKTKSELNTEETAERLDALYAMSEDKEHLYLLPLSTGIIYDRNVFETKKENVYANVVFIGGWMASTPSRERALAAYGLRRPVVDAVDNAKVFVGAGGIDHIAAYASEELGRPVEAVRTGNNPLAPYQLVSSDAG